MKLTTTKNNLETAQTKDLVVLKDRVQLIIKLVSCACRLMCQMQPQLWVILLQLLLVPLLRN